MTCVLKLNMLVTFLMTVALASNSTVIQAPIESTWSLPLVLFIVVSTTVVILLVQNWVKVLVGKWNNRHLPKLV